MYISLFTTQDIKNSPHDYCLASPISKGKKDDIGRIKMISQKWLHGYNFVFEKGDLLHFFLNVESLD